MTEPNYHQINLSRMWNSNSDSSGAERIDLSNDSFEKLECPALLTRSFNRPTNLDSESKVFLQFEHLPLETEFRLNGDLLGSCKSETSQFEITNCLQLSNQIEISFTAGIVSAVHKARASLIIESSCIIEYPAKTN